jgi:CRP-like cAMP-binding protein
MWCRRADSFCNFNVVSRSVQSRRQAGAQSRVRALLSKVKNGQATGVEIRNHILKSVSASDRRALDPYLTPIQLQSGAVLFEPDALVDRVYFPNTAVLSVVMVMEDGRTVETDTVGYESAVGVLAALGVSQSVNRIFTQIPGAALSIPASRLRAQADASPPLRVLLLRHAQANLAQAHQSVACNALHAVEQRLCRWLLASHDRTASDTIHITQQYLATMVGVQRTTVTQALHQLASAGLVRQGRGWVRIVHRKGIETRACECYAALRYTLDRVIGVTL